ncbi:MAG TPA: hypothetical protein DDW23_08475 [Planctomycetes bacterium]|nr:hypothetical protein [Planctomycetota bacterium]
MPLYAELATQLWPNPFSPKPLASSTPPRDAVAVVLAAGRGSRLGFPKAALEVGGEWALPRIVDALREGGAHKVAVVLSKESKQAIEGKGGTAADVVVLNQNPEAGRTGTLQVGLEALNATEEEYSVLVHPCDVPLISQNIVKAIIKSFQESPMPEEAMARPVTPGGRGGHPLLLGQSRIQDVARFSPDQPLRDLLALHTERLIDVPVEDLGPFMNINHPEQLEMIESFLSG